MVCSYEEIIDPSCLLHRGKSNHRPKLSTAPWEVQFAKNEQENLTKAERNELAKLTTLLVQTWEKRNKSK